MISRTAHELPPPLAVVAGIRTPLAKAFGALERLPAHMLGCAAVSGLLSQTGMPAERIDEVVFGNVAGPPEASNVARVIALSAGIPVDRLAHTVNRNCASGMESIVTAWQIIREGRAGTVIAGGTESMSNVPLLWGNEARRLLFAAARERRLRRKLAIWSRMRPRMLKPVPALELGLTDGSCGLRMGDTAEVLAREFAVTREQQDAFALSSHQRAIAARQRCFFQGEVLPLPPALTGAQALHHDTGPRAEQSVAALAALKPVFQPGSGTVTVGNSCPITDGAVALLLMTPEDARAAGYRPLGYLRAYALAGCEPSRMGLGPVFAIHRLLLHTRRSLRDFDLFEMNEAFAAQVLACLQALNSEAFSRQHLNRERAIGELPPDRLNVNGGAIALGHPVGATGARLVLTLLRALRERHLRNGLASLCIGGGQGAAMWVQTELDATQEAILHD